MNQNNPLNKNSVTASKIDAGDQIKSFSTNREGEGGASTGGSPANSVNGSPAGNTATAATAAKAAACAESAPASPTFTTSGSPEAHANARTIPGNGFNVADLKAAKRAARKAGMKVVVNSDGTITLEEQDKKRKKLLLILFAILLSIAGVAGVYMMQNAYDDRASKIAYADKSYDDIVAELDEATRKSLLTIAVANKFSVAADGTCSASNSDGNAVPVLTNSERNHKDIKYTIYFDDNGTQRSLYQTSLLKPGESIVNPVIDRTGIAPGTYQVTITAQGYDADTHAATGGTVSGSVSMTVE